ncbi:PH domain-containing protein [Thalassobacillus hwangdonensis]|uniref:PH domain-containing protein n=1 Tax=Thalassobacillus hwangdonensis TaxID=546108 RepID=A0ABW3L2J3_9BACI
MVFRSRVDRFFVIFIVIVVTLLGAVSFLPVMIEDDPSLSTVAGMTFTFVLLATFVVWWGFSVKYVLHEDYLFVRGGPFRSRIPYQDITLVSSSSDIFTGYRVLSARDGIEIFYKQGLWGSVKISPKNQQAFINELKQRCLNATFRI